MINVNNFSWQNFSNLIVYRFLRKKSVFKLCYPHPGGNMTKNRYFWVSSNIFSQFGPADGQLAYIYTIFEEKKLSIFKKKIKFC